MDLEAPLIKIRNRIKHPNRTNTRTDAQYCRHRMHLCHPLSNTWRSWSLKVKFGTRSTFKGIVRRGHGLDSLIFERQSKMMNDETCDIHVTYMWHIDDTLRQVNHNEGDHGWPLILSMCQSPLKPKTRMEKTEKQWRKNNRRLQGRRLNWSCLWTSQAQKTKKTKQACSYGMLRCYEEAMQISI